MHALQWLLCLAVQSLVTALFLAAPINVIPGWLVNIYSLVVSNSSTVWQAAETVALFQLCCVASQTIISYSDHATWGSVIKVTGF